MKTFLSALLFFLFISVGHAQNLLYEIHGKNTRGVSKEKVHAAKTLTDLRSGYPSFRIDGLTYTEIQVTTDGKVKQATGDNETLSAEQQNLLQLADVGSDINVEFGFVPYNQATLFPDIHQDHFDFTVVPEVEASYPGGYQELSLYLEKNAIDKINEKFSKKMGLVVITFSVTETGEIENAQIIETSKNPEVDQLLLKALLKMPNWLPALNAEGEKIRQEFEFTVGNGC